MDLATLKTELTFFAELPPQSIVVRYFSKEAANSGRKPKRFGSREVGEDLVEELNGKYTEVAKNWRRNPYERTIIVVVIVVVDMILLYLVTVGISCREE